MAFSRPTRLLIGFTCLLGIAASIAVPPKIFIYIIALLPLLIFLFFFPVVRRSRNLTFRDILFGVPTAVFLFGALAGILYLSPSRLTAALGDVRRTFISTKVLMIGQPLPVPPRSQSDQIAHLESRLQRAKDFGLVSGPDPYLEAGLLSFLSGNFSNAAKLFGSAGVLVQRSSVIANDLGVAYYSNRSATEAEAQFREAIQYAIEPDPVDSSKATLAVAYNNLGVTLRDQGKLSESLDNFQIALKNAQDTETLLTTKLNIAGTYRLQARYDEAINIADQVLKMSELPDHWVAAAIRLEGVVKEDQGDFDSALDNYGRAAALYEKERYFQDLAVTYNNMGNVYVNKPDRDLDEALHFHQLALDINKKLGREIDEADNYGNMAYVYLEKGNLDEAMHNANQALDVYRLKGYLIGQAAVLDTIGLIFLKKGEEETAISYFQDSLHIARQSGFRIGQTETLIHLGSIFAKRHEYKKAKALVLEAEAIFEQSGADQKAENVRKMYQKWPTGSSGRQECPRS